jgi:hypothetical protein
MAQCRNCKDFMFWAWNAVEQRWLPCDLESLDGNEKSFTEDSVFLESHHRRHRCGFKYQAVDNGSSPHATLFVTSDAPVEVIRAAYRALAQLHHPDVGGDSERMQAINVAYDDLVGRSK